MNSLINEVMPEPHCDAKSSLGAGVVCYVHCLLATEFGTGLGDPVVESSLDALPPAERLNITFRTAGRLRGSMSGSGLSLGEQLRAAVKNAALDMRFDSPLSLGDLRTLSVEVWIQVRSTAVSVTAREDAKVVVLGKHGVEVERGGMSAYFKPSVAITSRHKSLDDFMGAVCRKAGLAKHAWKDPQTNVKVTEWVCYFREKGVVRSIPGLNQLNVTAEHVRTWIRESVEYLCSSQQITGDVTYLYDPISDSQVAEEPSTVRYSGCIYALSQVLDNRCEWLDVDSCEKLTNRMIARQLEHSAMLPTIGRVITERRSSSPPKLGSTALLALALGSEALRTNYASIYQELYQSVVAAQKPDGRFITHFCDPVESARSAEFFSGQALLVIAEAAARGDARAHKLCHAAFDSYRQQFRSKPSTAFVGWHADAWSRCALVTGNSEYGEFVFEQVDWLLKMQENNGGVPEWTGAFAKKRHAPTFSSIVYVEAVVRGFVTALSQGDQRRQITYREAIRLGLKFCSRLRLSESPSAWFPNPSRSHGGVGLSLTDMRVRCDVPQHLITLGMAVLDNKDYLF